jgi:hypothetical protein
MEAQTFLEKSVPSTTIQLLSMTHVFTSGKAKSRARIDDTYVDTDRRILLLSHDTYAAISIILLHNYLVESLL